MKVLFWLVISLIKNLHIIISPGTLVYHKWENCLSLDAASWGYRSEMIDSDVITIDNLIEEVVSTVSCGGKIEDFVLKGTMQKIRHHIVFHFQYDTFAVLFYCLARKIYLCHRHKKVCVNNFVNVLNPRC